MPTQSASNVLAAIKREASGTPGTAAASGAGAIQLRILDSPGLKLDRSAIQSNERRNDLLSNMGRLGGKSVGGSYNAELTLGGATDSLLEAIMRSVWSAALAVALGATDGTTTANTIVRATGSWITDGYREGDIVTITGDATAANNNIRLRVTGVTATTLTLAGSPLTANATARAFTVTRLKKLTNPTNPTRYSYTVEQYDEDIDLAELFLGCRLTGLSLAFRPNAVATVTYTFTGMDRTLLTEGQTPYFTSPSLTVGVPLIADDSAIRYNGADVTKFTSLDINMQIAAAGQPVIGSFTSPDIYDNTLSISGSVSGIREDFSRLNLFENETEFELSALFTEPGDAPLGALGIYLPRVKFGTPDAPFMGGDGPKVETLPLMIAPHAGSTVVDASAINFFSSAA